MFKIFDSNAVDFIDDEDEMDCIYLKVLDVELIVRSLVLSSAEARVMNSDNYHFEARNSAG